MQCSHRFNKSCMMDLDGRNGEKQLLMQTFSANSIKYYILNNQFSQK